MDADVYDYLDQLMSAKAQGCDFAPPPVEVTILDLFEFSGLTRASWCAALGISDALWAKIRQGHPVGRDRLDHAFETALSSHAVIAGLLSIRDRSDIMRVRKAINPY